MNGHQRIVEMRLRGVVPTVVWVNDMAGYRVDPEDETVTVSVHGDTPEALDFRFLEGVERVIFESASQDRVDRFLTVLMQHARSVFASTWLGEDLPKIVRVIGPGEANWQI